MTRRSFTGACGRFAVMFVQVAPPSVVFTTYGLWSPARNPLYVTYTTLAFLGSMVARATPCFGSRGEVPSVHSGPPVVVVHTNPLSVPAHSVFGSVAAAAIEVTVP